MKKGDEVQTKGCDLVEIGWGIMPDGRKVVILKPTWEGDIVAGPVGLELPVAQKLLKELAQQIEKAELGRQN